MSESCHRLFFRMWRVETWFFTERLRLTDGSSIMLEFMKGTVGWSRDIVLQQ